MFLLLVAPVATTITDISPEDSDPVNVVDANSIFVTIYII